ncbi:MAG: TlpA family protein disulfide reductase [Marinifilaceae bacterium]
MKKLINITLLLMGTLVSINNSNAQDKIVLRVINSKGTQDSIIPLNWNKKQLSVDKSVQLPIIGKLCINDTITMMSPIVLDRKNTDISINNAIYTLKKPSALQSALNHYLTELDLIQKKNADISQRYKIAKKDNNLSEIMHLRYLDMDNEQKKQQLIDSVIQHQDNLIAAYIVASNSKSYIRNKTLVQKMDMLGSNARQCKEVAWLESTYQRLSAFVPGGKAPNFELTDIKGQKQSLHSVQGKVKLVDFWASWCGPCRAESPHLKELYAKYKDKGLQIVGVSLDTKQERWEKAVQQDGLPWIHMSDLKGWDSDITKLYFFNSIPTMVLIDENNNIIEYGVRGKRIEEILSEYFD